MSSISRLHRFDLSLYLVANKSSFQDENLFFSKIQKAARGGVSCVQFRDHTSDYLTSLRIASRLKEILEGVPLFINTIDSIKLAQSIDAEGVYLEEIISPFEARSLLGEKAIIGIPARTMTDLINYADSFDYLSVKVFPSKKTCPKNDLMWGIEGLQKIRMLAPHRIVAIGGLDWTCVEPIYEVLNPDDGIAMAGGLMAEDDPYLTAQKIQAIRRKVRGQE